MTVSPHRENNGETSNFRNNMRQNEITFEFLNQFDKIKYHAKRKKQNIKNEF